MSDDLRERIPQTATRRPGQVRIVFTELDPGNGERPLVSADYFVDRGSLIEFAEGRFVAEKDSFGLVDGALDLEW